MSTELANEAVAQALDEIGELLAAQDAQPFRSAAYHRAADVVRTLVRPVRELAGDPAALTMLPAVGPGIARVIAELVRSGRSELLERLRGQADPETLLATVPGLGQVLASRLHDVLGIDTLEELEVAAHDGRLARVPGFGPRRIRAMVDALAGRLGRRGRSVRGEPVSDAVDVGELLDVDREYREKAAAGLLRRIAPRRFNPRHRAWLPVLHSERGGRHYTALFSNTARAHELGTTGDWVVVFRDDGARERQATVVTERRGALVGRRVVRGHEAECSAYYRGHPAAPDASEAPVAAAT